MCFECFYQRGYYNDVTYIEEFDDEDFLDGFWEWFEFEWVEEEVENVV